MTLGKYSLLIYLLLRPFYLFSSGGLQIADGFLLLAFVLYFATSWLSSVGRRDLTAIMRQHKIFIIFVVMTFVVNGLYFIIYPEIKFLLSSLYFVFNLLAIIVFTAFLKDRVFLSRVGAIFKLNLSVQLLIWIADIGRYYSADRYMGTFNDPNQFGYFIFLSFLFVYVIDMILKKNRTYLYYILTLFLIVQSGSTGMLLGLGVFSVLAATYLLKKQLSSPYRLVQKIFIAMAAVAALSVPLTVIAFASFDVTKLGIASLSNSSLFARIEEKSDRATGETEVSLLEDRNLDIMTEYPHLMLLGAGEGAFDRFEKAAHPGSEIHSTFPAILFYYGVVPLLLLIVWMYNRLKGATWGILLAYLSLFSTSFILLNQRQALFWVFVVLGGIYIEKLNTNKLKKQKSIHRKIFFSKVPE